MPEAEARVAGDAHAEVEAAREALGLDVADGIPKELIEEEAALEDAPKTVGDAPKRKGLAALIADMTIIEKIKLARFGNSEARGLLIRERNKIVACAAIRSPKLTDREVVAFAQARNLSDEVIRIIATNREWTRSYQVVLALVKNPKAPLLFTIKFLNRLTDRDLATIMRSREVPGQIKQTARRTMMRRGKK